MTNMPRHRTVSDVMTARVHVAGPEMPFKILVRLIEENRISAVPIVNERGYPIGIVSESDLLFKERRSELESSHDFLHPRRNRLERAKADGDVASNVMTAPPITVGMDASLAAAARTMQEKNVRRLVVVDAQGRIAGIVSRSDLLNVFLRSDKQLHDEVVDELVPALWMQVPGTLRVAVHMNVVSFTGEVDRKSDVDLLVRLTKQLDGVVDVVERLTYRWDDTDAASMPRSSIDRTTRAV
jgi:CBS domain-containing protein